MITWKHHTKLNSEQIDNFDIEVVDFHLDAKREDIIKIFEEVEKKITKEWKNKSSELLNAHDILTGILIDKTSTVKSTLKHILNTGPYKELKDTNQLKPYFQQEKDLVVRLRNILDLQIDVIDKEIEHMLSQNLVIPEEMLLNKRSIKDEKDKLTIFASALKDYIRK